MSDAPVAFWVDTDYDRENSSDGRSRYGAYLHDAAFEPWTDNDRSVEWAAFAWRCATGPVMSPGYVRYHPRVLAAQLERSGWDGSLIASVSLACSWPDQLKTMLIKPLPFGGQAAYWQDWPTEYLGGNTRYYEPGEADLAARPYVLTTLSLQFTVPSAALPEPPVDTTARLGAAQHALAVLVSELNRIVGPGLSALSGSPHLQGRGTGEHSPNQMP